MYAAVWIHTTRMHHSSGPPTGVRRLGARHLTSLGRACDPSRRPELAPRTPGGAVAAGPRGVQSVFQAWAGIHDVLCKTMDTGSFRPIYTRTLWAPIGRIFSSHSVDPIHQLIARAIVLYEDIRLEVLGMSADQRQLTRLDLPSHKYRELYFIRRAMVTLLEFAHAVHELQMCETFKVFKVRLTPKQLKPWSEAVTYFASKRDELKAIRDAVGGHFGKPAARIAVNDISSDYTAKVELRSDMGEKAIVFSEFATEFVATALFARCPGNTQEERAEYLMTLLLEANRYAAGASYFLLVEYVWPRFEG